MVFRHPASVLGEFTVYKRAGSTKLHRNPLIHPEVILTVEEAIGIIGMARGVIAMMLQAMPDVPTTTGASSTASVDIALPQA